METVIIGIDHDKIDKNCESRECRCGKLEEISRSINIDNKECDNCHSVGHWYIPKVKGASR